MDVSAVAPAPPLTVSRIHPDESRRRRLAVEMDPEPQGPASEWSSAKCFDSSAPVVVGPMTEVAVSHLKRVNGLSLAEAQQRYADAE